jgi:hypothetical protein
MYLGRGDEWLAGEIEEPLDVAKAQQWLDNNPEIYSTPGLRVGDWEGAFEENPSLAKYRVTLVAYTPQEEMAKELENPLDNTEDKFESRRWVAHVNYSPETHHRGTGDFAVEIYDWHTSDMTFRVVNNILDAVKQFIDYWREMRDV